MSIQFNAFRKKLVAFCIGGCAFQFLGFGVGGNCFSTQDFLNLYQGIGDNVVDAAVTSAFETIGGDIATVATAPTSTFFQAGWDNWVANGFPRGGEGEVIVRQ